MRGRLIQLRVPEEVAERVEIEAKSKGLSIASFVRMLLYEKIGVGRNEANQ